MAHSELHKCASVPASVLPCTSCPSTMTTMTRVDVPPSGTSSDTRSSPLSEIKPKPVPLDPMTSKILIISMGTFDLSTAYHLQENGFRDVVVLDRVVELPARDAASMDINKGVYHVQRPYYSLHRIHHAWAMKCACTTRTRLTKKFSFSCSINVC